MAIRVYDKSESPLTVELNLEGQGGLALMEVWVKDVAEATFKVYGNHDGKDGTWRLIDELDIPTNRGKQEAHEGYFNCYQHIRVTTDSLTESEIELIAGEM